MMGAGGGGMDVGSGGGSAIVWLGIHVCGGTVVVVMVVVGEILEVVVRDPGNDDGPAMGSRKRRT